MATSPEKSYAKVRRDRWVTGYAVAATAALGLSLTAQFTDLDERATQSIKDRYNSIVETISGIANDAHFDDPAITSTPTQAYTMRPPQKPVNFAEIVQETREAQTRAAVQAALAEIAPAGPGEG